MDQWWIAGIAFAAAFGGGAVNSLAGGGTLLSFPTLLALGVPPVSANVTSAVALWPGGFGAVWGFRREIETAERWWLWLLLPSLAGGVVGAFALVRLPAAIFTTIAPYLILLATALIALQRPIEKKLRAGIDGDRAIYWRIVAVVGQLLISAYGGYFGASMGILMLSALTLFGVSSIRQANGLKNLFSLGVRGVAVALFALTATVVWDAAILMAIGATIGGYAAGALSYRIDDRTMRLIIVVIGVCIAGVMAMRSG
ncbi:MAG: sulfite exporter TauE/SafE family protein [Chloroflexi bacterium]|nr:sulfite exporter TauE/SafE family protein [Chloroflexota bacterium]